MLVLAPGVFFGHPPIVFSSSSDSLSLQPASGERPRAGQTVARPHEETYLRASGLVPPYTGSPRAVTGTSPRPIRLKPLIPLVASTAVGQAKQSEGDIIVRQLAAAVLSC